jgi:hypothetical protein
VKAGAAPAGEGAPGEACAVNPRIGMPFRQLQLALHKINFWKYFSSRR